MDKSSPVYENFAKKMDAMSGRPKINRQTIKFGAGMGLEGRVSNNERKITLLKNIFKAQKVEIGEKITPKVNTLELSLNETTKILDVITQKLSVEMSERLKEQKTLFDAQRKKNLDDKRDKKEESLENKKKSKIGNKIAKKVLQPFGDIFNKLLSLAGILGTGLLSTNFIKRINNPEFQQKIKDIYDWTTKNWKAIAVGAGIIGTIFAAGAIKSFILGAGSVFGLLTNPIVLTALGLIGLGILGYKLGKPIFDAKMKEIDTSRSALKDSGISDTNAEILATTLATDFASSLITKADGQYDGIGAGDFTNVNPYDLSSNISGDVGGDAFQGFVLNSLFDDKKNINDLSETIGKIPFTKKGIEQRNLLKESGSKTIFTELPDIDLTSNERNEIGGMNPNPATGIPEISSMNMSNPYMEDTPELFGFKDIIYS
tara:strand:- start:299 stop:1588 length:1290 start_codon:yes stop_codon:yes gene_type:complete